MQLGLLGHTHATQSGEWQTLLLSKGCGGRGGQGRVIRLEQLLTELGEVGGQGVDEFADLLHGQLGHTAHMALHQLLSHLGGVGCHSVQAKPLEQSGPDGYHLDRHTLISTWPSHAFVKVVREKVKVRLCKVFVMLQCTTTFGAVSVKICNTSTYSETPSFQNLNVLALCDCVEACLRSKQLHDMLKVA